MRIAATTAIFCSISYSASIALPVQWNAGVGSNGHWYEFVILTSSTSVLDAEIAAEEASFMGLSGYLATITSPEEQAFLNTIWPGATSVSGQFGGYSYFLIGGSDRETEGIFKWIGGPEEGTELEYTNWEVGEPNNLDIEDYIVGWWADNALGNWNDGGNSTSGTNVVAYLVEYSEPIADVPVPFGLPMLLAGLGSLVVLSKRRT